MSVLANNLDLVKLFIEKGADLNIKCTGGYYRGCSPIDAAERNHYNEIENILAEQLSSFSKESDNKLISITKELYIKTFPRHDGYLTVWSAFEKYFDKTQWLILGKNRKYVEVYFSGVFKYNNRKALLEIQFKIQNYDNPEIKIDWVLVNRNELPKSSLNDLLFDVFLNSKI